LLRANNPVQQYLAITSIFSAKERGETSPRTRLNTERDLRQWFTSQNTVVQDSLRFEFDVQLPENMLMKTDRMSLAHAVEARVPLLDTKVLAVAGRIPLSWKLRGNTEKYIFRKTMAPLLPKIIAQRKKQRFYVPINDWLVKCRPLLDRLFAPEMLRHGLLDARAIQRIRDKYRNAPLFYARQLWSLLTFQLWYEQFILGEKRAP
jgi:asparagine synthase (glutamine-hydrolysing)